MSSLGSTLNKSPGKSDSTLERKECVETRLREAGVRVARSVPVEDGTKEPNEPNHQDPSNQTLPGLIDGNCSIHGGDGLVILDIDDHSELPQRIRDLPETFIVKTPHGGEHRYYALEDDTGISSTKTAWGSTRSAGWYTLAPGSTIDHARCDDGKEGCPGQGIGTYDPAIDVPIATLSGEDLDALRKTSGSIDGGNRSKGEEYGGEMITLPDETIVEEANQYLCTDFPRHSTQLAGCDMMDLLRGGTGSYDLRRDDGTETIDQSAADYYALEAVYGAFRFRGEDKDEAQRLTLAIFKHYCRERPHDKTGTLRKWLQKGEGYLNEQMDGVQKGFDFGPWHRWRRREYEGGFDPDEHKPWIDPATDGEASLITKDTIRATLHLLTSDLDPEWVAQQYGLDLSMPQPSCGEMCTPLAGITSRDSGRYPTASEVGEVAAELNPDRKASYFEETLREFCRETEEVAHAYCPSRPNGERHVYYLAGLPDPEDARWVKVGGEKQSESNPEPDEEAEPEILTDGGVSEAPQAGDDRAEPEVFVCPVDGCSRTVIGNPGDLRNHVRQAEDEGHQHRSLDENLEVVVRWEAMDWGWGAPEFEK